MLYKHFKVPHKKRSLHSNILLHNDYTRYERKKEHDFIEIFSTVLEDLRILYSKAIQALQMM